MIIGTLLGLYPRALTLYSKEPDLSVCTSDSACYPAQQRSVVSALSEAKARETKCLLTWLHTAVRLRLQSFLSSSCK